MEEKVINLNQLIANRKSDTRIQEQIKKKSTMYQGDFNRFKQYAQQEGLNISFDTLIRYLIHTVESGLKLNTFNRRSAGVKHFLVNVHGQTESAEQNKRIVLLRGMYNDDDFIEQKRVNGQSSKPKDEVMTEINKLNVRAKAICLFNLITACRPSEMVLVKISHINFDKGYVDVYMKKQKMWKPKYLTVEVLNTIKEYMKAYNLTSDSYFVGEVNRHKQYTSKQITDIAYRKSIHKWLGFAPYALRKTQISAMHKAGADLATIAEQSGHSNLETIKKHYLSVDGDKVKKYL